MLIDSHAHLLDERFDEDRGEVIASLSHKGILAVIECATGPADIAAAAQLAAENPAIYAAVGVHPHDARSYTPKVEAQIRELSRQSKVAAIGEIGLDYHYDFSPRPVQQGVLRRQLALAQELGLPVILHNRESTADMLEILREFAPLQGVMHCFSGSLETMKILLDMGLYIGIGGSLTFKNSVKPVEAAKQVPQDRFLIETDSPYLAPVPMRGKRNEPSFTRYVAERLAGLRSQTQEEIQAQAVENTRRLFSKIK